MATEGQSLKQAFKAGVLWSVVQKWGDSALNFIVFLVLVRLLEPEDFGLVAMASVLIAFLRAFVDQGFGSAIVQRHADLEPRFLNTAFWFTLGAGILLAAASVAGSDLVAGFFHEPRLNEVVDWLSLIFVFTALSVVHEALLRRRFAFRQLAYRSLLGVSIGGTVGLGMALSGFGVWSLVARAVVGSFASTVMLWWVSDWRPGIAVSLRHLRELVGFGSPILGANLLLAANKQIDQLLIGYLFNPQVLGLYTVARTAVRNLADLVNGVAVQVGLPTFSRMQTDPPRARAALYRITRASSLVAFPVFFGVAVLAPELVVLVFGPAWASAIPVLQILAFLSLLQCLTSWSTVIMTAFGRPMWRFGMAALNGLTNAAAVALAAPWGVVAVAGAVTARAYLILPVHNILMRRLIVLEIRGYLRQVSSPLLASVVATSIVWAAKQLPIAASFGSMATVLIGASLGALAYGATLAALEPTLVRSLWRTGAPRVSKAFARSSGAT